MGHSSNMDLSDTLSLAAQKVTSAAKIIMDIRVSSDVNDTHDCSRISYAVCSWSV